MNSLQAEELSISPLSPSGPVEQLYSVESASIEDRWMNEFGIEISKFWQVPPKLKCFRCLDSDLVFFQPDGAAGSGGLYEQLQKFDWYYMPYKWEHQQAVIDIDPGSKVLEVGCGAGGFLERLNVNHDVMGVELNASAVENAQKRGLDVRHESLSQLHATLENAFDVVCHFEVLEHVTQQLTFLEECVRLIRPGGRLLFAIPNMDSFLRHDTDLLLNLPPHHMSQWTPQTVRYLESVLPIRLERITFEPLAEYHVDFYSDIYWKRLTSGIARGHRFLIPILKVFKRALRVSAIRRFVRGHTMYACFEKVTPVGGLNV